MHGLTIKTSQLDMPLSKSSVLLIKDRGKKVPSGQWEVIAKD